MTKENFLKLIDRFTTKHKYTFEYREFETRLVAMESNKGFMFYVDESDNTEDNLVTVSFCYDLNPNGVKNLMIRLLVFMDAENILFDFSDEFYISTDSSLVFGEIAKDEWRKTMVDDLNYDYKKERNIDKLWESYQECDFVHC